MKKKITLMCILMVLCAAALSACGSDPMIVQETKTGMNLEDKARELTGQQGDEADENEKDLEHTPE